MRGGPKLYPAVAALGGALAVAACAAVPPTGPTVVAIPPRGKSLAAFQREDAGCRGYAGAAIGATNAAAGGYSLQARYNTAYTQCMYARGNSVRAPPPDGGAGYPAYAGPYPYPSPWYGPGPYPWYGGGLFGPDIVVFGGGGRHFHDGSPGGGFPGGGSATGGSGSWRSGGFHGGGPATGGSTPWRR